MNTPDEYINNIKTRQLNSDREYILDSLTGAIDRLEKAFPRYGSFLMEFIQNADDALSNSLKIELSQAAIRIFNDGQLFQEENVKSICKVGRSSKKPEDNIGYLGVGFKSVFLISDRPEIYSGEFRFKFDKNAWHEQLNIPWQIIPLWIDSPTPPFNASSKYQTIFNIPLKEAISIDRLKVEITPENLNNRILLFLRNIKEIEIMDISNSLCRKIQKIKMSESSGFETYTILEYENDNLKNQDYWVIFSSVSEVPTKVKVDFITKDWERDGIEKREVLIALRLNEDNTLVVEKKGTAHIGVFSFLPLKEIPSGLNFLMQADFLTNPGRGELARECAWNNWLADEIYRLIIQKSVPILLNHENWKMNFTEVLYPQKGGHELFEFFIKKPLREYLEKNEVLIAEDGSTAKFNELVAIDSEIRALLSDEDIARLYPNKKVIHHDCKPHSKLIIQYVPTELYSFVNESGELLKYKAQINDIGWFITLYSMFVKKYSLSNFREKYPHYNVDHDKFWNRMRDFPSPIILTENYSLAKISECLLNLNKIKIPDEIKNLVNIAHPQLTKNANFQSLIKKLNEERHHEAPNLNFFLSNGCSIYAGSKAINQSGSDYISILENVRATEFNKKILSKIKSLKGLRPEQILDQLSQIQSYLENVENSPRQVSRIEKLISLIKKQFLDNCVIPIDYSRNEYHKLLLKKIVSRPSSLNRVNIFTINYDLLIEKTAEDLEIVVNNGFVGFHNRTFLPSAFKLGLFTKETTTSKQFPRIINLFKLHGSISWRFSQENQNNPYGIEEVQITQHKIESSDALPDCIIYPIQHKKRYSLDLPYSELLRQLIENLHKPNSVLMIIGYSFMDEHINDLILNALLNPDFHLIIFSYQENAELSQDQLFLKKLIEKSKTDSRITIFTGHLIGNFENIVKYFMTYVEEKDFQKIRHDTVKDIRDGIQKK